MTKKNSFRRIVLAAALGSSASLAATAGSSFGADLCNTVRDEGVRTQILGAARSRLSEMGYESLEFETGYVVVDCREYYIFANNYDLNVLGGLYHVLVSKYGTILHVMVWG